MQSISSLKTIGEYVEKFSFALGEKVASQCEPLHDPEKQGNHPRLAGIKTVPLPKQAVRITAIVKQLKRSKFYIDAGCMGVGKAQPDDYPVLTPTGWQPIGSLKVGDDVISPDNTIQKVTGVFPQGEVDVCRVTFTDGSTTECCHDHLWSVSTPGRKYAGLNNQVYTAADLHDKGLFHASGNTKYFIPMCPPIEFAPVPLPLDPYLLGLILGDGSITQHNCTIHTTDNEIVTSIKNIVPRYGNLVAKNDGQIGWRITTGVAGKKNAVIDILRELHLFGCNSTYKFIPKVYLHGCIMQRESLLQGLLDTDGHVTHNKHTIEYSTVSRMLADGVKELVTSLGGTCRVTTKTGTYMKEGNRYECQLVYRLFIALPNSVTPFRLTRKCLAYEPRTKYFPRRGIKDIALYHRKASCTCISISGPDKLYITNDYIVTHNTMQALSAVHCHSEGKPYVGLIMCPPTLRKKWRDEIHKFLGKSLVVVLIEGWRHFIELIKQPKPKVPTWYILAQTTAKLGYSRRCASIKKTKRVMDEELGLVDTECQCCAICDYPAYHRGLVATASDIERGHLKCVGMWCKACGISRHHSMETCNVCEGKLRKCNEPMVQPSSHRVSVVHLAKHYGWRPDYYIRDEAHKSKNSESMDGHANAVFSTLGRHSLWLTGTLLDGKSESIRPMLFRKLPGKFIDMGFGWKSEIPFGYAYGRIQTVVRKSEGGRGDRRKTGKGSNKSTSRDVKPGIMPQLFPDFIANYTAFMSLSDVATDLPGYIEETVAVPMCEKMKLVHDAMQKHLLDAFKGLYTTNRKLAVKLLFPMLECLMNWPDVPYGRKPIIIDDDGEPLFIIQPPDLDRTATYAKETRLVEYLREERAAGRQCWVYSDRDTTRERLEYLLASNGFKVAHLTSSVEPDKRIDWLKKHAPSCDVGLCNAALVETGMELFGPGFNFPTLIWYGTGWSLNTLRQASRRAWRIGQTKDCKTVYMFYDESAQQKAIGLMASKLVAAEAIEGKFSDGGLAAQADDDDIALQIAKALADNIEIKMHKTFNPIANTQSKTDFKALLLKKLHARMAERTV